MLTTSQGPRWRAFTRPDVEAVINELRDLAKKSHEQATIAPPGQHYGNLMGRTEGYMLAIDLLEALLKGES